MTDHYEKVTHFAVELTETEFADLHQKVFEKGVADLAEAKCPVKSSTEGRVTIVYVVL